MFYVLLNGVWHMAKNIRQIFKDKMLGLAQEDAKHFPDLKESDFLDFHRRNTSLMSGDYKREDLNLAWIGFCAMLNGFDELDVVVSVDMTAFDNDNGERVFAKIEEWNDLTVPIDEGREVGLVAVYQSHNFDISTFKDPYTGKNKKHRPK